MASHKSPQKSCVLSVSTYTFTHVTAHFNLLLLLNALFLFQIQRCGLVENGVFYVPHQVPISHLRLSQCFETCMRQHLVIVCQQFSCKEIRIKIFCP